ncbi:DUF4265 domain-containing protein [Lentzea sp. NBRC 102530]|uniref:DUF4265 domain-containing protein n=1 Tax=Lentzea sp. NBRC 102530 TaxID=3032201 RepID=UPI00255210BF|nr:DUF4265 domain-containing protein [Lentzea sp. NBRC 102530]
MQVTIDGVTYVSHEDPVWRAENSHLAMVDLAPFDLQGMREQLWLRETVDDGEYEICCLPFYAYGLALGDVVGKSGSENVGTVIRKSGRRVLRIMFAEPRFQEGDSRAVLREVLDAAGLLSEWNGDRFIAIDVPDISVMQPIFDSVQAEIQNGTAFWEWGDSRGFAQA